VGSYRSQLIRLHVFESRVSRTQFYTKMSPKTFDCKVGFECWVIFGNTTSNLRNMSGSLNDYHFTDKLFRSPLTYSSQSYNAVHLAANCLSYEFSYPLAVNSSLAVKTGGGGGSRLSGRQEGRQC
jgi:hypothetical protein